MFDAHVIAAAPTVLRWVVTVVRIISHCFHCTCGKWRILRSYQPLLKPDEWKFPSQPKKELAAESKKTIGLFWKNSENKKAKGAVINCIRLSDSTPIPSSFFGFGSRSSGRGISLGVTRCRSNASFDGTWGGTPLSQRRPIGLSV